MADIDNQTSPAAADAAILEPATHEAEITRHNSPIGQPAIPNGTAAGTTPAKVTDTNPNPTPATKGTVEVNNGEVKLDLASIVTEITKRLGLPNVSSKLPPSVARI